MVSLFNKTNMMPDVPTGHIFELVCKANRTGKAATLASCMLLVLMLPQLKRIAARFKIKGLTTAEVQGVAVNAFVTRAIPHWWHHFIAGDGCPHSRHSHDSDLDFVRFSTLVVRRALAVRLKQARGGTILTAKAAY